MDISSGLQASLGGRYATALFELARDSKSLDTVDASVAKLRAALDESPEFRQLIGSQVVSRKQSRDTVAALAGTMALDETTANFLGVLAENRRLAALPRILAAFNALLAAHRGEIAAEVTSAYPLTEAQLDAIRSQLKSRAGHEIKITTHVDPSILGGLVVRMGSQMIDSSIKTRLNTLSQAMKG